MIEVFTIGTEVVQGFTVNTNATFLSQELLKEGFVPSRQTTVSDKYQDLKNGIIEVCARSNIVIATGGLGPTEDDVTRKVMAEIVDSDFRYDEKVAEDLKNRFGDTLKSLEDQATVPSKAKVIINTVGTAPGFIFQVGGATLIMLPGVPNEMKPMFLNDVIPYLKKHFLIEKRLYRKRLHLIKLCESDVDPSYRRLSSQYPNIEFCIYPAHGLLSLDLSIYADTERQAFEILQEPVKIMKNEFGDFMYESKSGKIEEAIQNRFVSNKWTLSLAESCTGGAIASCLTQISGSSDYFLGSLVTYSNNLKKDLLGVDESVIKTKGVVSEDVVREMVLGLLQKTGSDYGIAVSGLTGPKGGTPEKPIGTVWAAIGHKDHVHSWKMHLRGTRAAIIEHSVNSVLGELYILTKSFDDI